MIRNHPMRDEERFLLTNSWSPFFLVCSIRFFFVVFSHYLCEYFLTLYYLHRKFFRQFEACHILLGAAEWIQRNSTFLLKGSIFYDSFKWTIFINIVAVASLSFSKLLQREITDLLAVMVF